MSEPGAARRMAGYTKTNRERGRCVKREIEGKGGRKKRADGGGVRNREADKNREWKRSRERDQVGREKGEAVGIKAKDRGERKKG